MARISPITINFKMPDGKVRQYRELTKHSEENRYFLPIEGKVEGYCLLIQGKDGKKYPVQEVKIAEHFGTGLVRYRVDTKDDPEFIHLVKSAIIGVGNENPEAKKRANGFYCREDKRFRRQHEGLDFISGQARFDVVRYVPIISGDLPHIKDQFGGIIV